MGYPIATLALAPWLIWQGRRVRRDTPRLPEPEGARYGVVGEAPHRRVLILGDSAAAGVGAQTQAQALSGRLVEALAPRGGVAWRLIARTGATTDATLRHLDTVDAERFDFAVISLGVNDITSGARIATWIAMQDALLDRLRDRFGIQCVLLCGLPPMHRFPALPQPLRWFLGERARRFDAALRELASRRADALHVPLDDIDDPTLMASDGFHPGPELYAHWGRMMAEIIASRVPASKS